MRIEIVQSQVLKRVVELCTPIEAAGLMSFTTDKNVPEKDPAKAALIASPLMQSELLLNVTQLLEETTDSNKILLMSLPSYFFGKIILGAHQKVGLTCYFIWLDKDRLEEIKKNLK